jgi:ATP-dependent exoDNAse (exonuclease V) beta subunit
MQSAHLLVRDSEALVDQLQKEQEFMAPSLDPHEMRHGPYPALHEFANVQAEREFLVHWVQDLLGRGYQHNEIAILHRKSWGPEKYLGALNAAGLHAIHLREDTGTAAQDKIVASTMHLAKGLEYKAIYIGQLQELYKTEKALTPAEYRQFLANETALLYVAITRARDVLCMGHQGKLARELGGLKTFLGEQNAQPGA